MSKNGRAAYRAAQSIDSHRINNEKEIPLITDTTEYITPVVAGKMLRRNKANRPINWNKVEEYRRIMEAGEWKFHSQGIILDEKGNVLTGQKRLWAIIYSDKPQYMRISKGTPSDRANLIDRGTSQSSRDLAGRDTKRKHSPMEASLARAILSVSGNTKPSLDEIATEMVNYSDLLSRALKQTRGTKKTKAMLMVLGALCLLDRGDLFGVAEVLAGELEKSLAPTLPEKCWNRGAAFTLAMEKAKKICNRNKSSKK